MHRPLVDLKEPRFNMRRQTWQGKRPCLKAVYKYAVQGNNYKHNSPHVFLQYDMVHSNGQFILWKMHQYWLIHKTQYLIGARLYKNPSRWEVPIRIARSRYGASSPVGSAKDPMWFIKIITSMNQRIRNIYLNNYNMKKGKIIGAIKDATWFSINSLNIARI